MGEVGRVLKRLGSEKAKSALDSGNEIHIRESGKNNFCPIMNSDQIESTLDVLIKLARLHLREKCDSEDVYECEICHGFLANPVTLACGHSFMRDCIPLDYGTAAWNCPKCKRCYSQSYLQRLRTNVMLSTLLEKWWPPRGRAAAARRDGERAFEQGKPKEAIKQFTRALELDPFCSLAALKRSVILFSIGQKQAALNDAELAVKLNPTWAKGYSQRGAILVSLKQYEPAIFSFLQSYLFSRDSEESKIISKQLIIETLSSPLLESSLPCLKLLMSTSLPPYGLIEKRKLAGSEGSLYSIDSMESLWASGEIDSEDDNLWLDVENQSKLVDEDGLFQALNNLVGEIQQNITEKKLKQQLRVNSKLVDKSDFECPLCMRLLLNPVTTPCGHTFCRACLERCFDYQCNCPLCKTDLYYFLAERDWSSTKLIDYAIKTLLPEEYAERKKVYDDEMTELAKAGKNSNHYIPLFICTVAFPTVPCPLHIFEPRYRLMIRQCMESGTRQFGMCAYLSNNDENISSVGTMLKIRNVKYLPDGRSIIDTVGTRRFHILERGMRDGYHTGAIEFLHDEPISESNRQETLRMYEETWKIADLWFKNLPRNTRETILMHFGPMPSFGESHISSPDGPSWLWWVLSVLPVEPKVQLQILGMTSLYLRLDAIRRVFQHIQSSDSL